MVCTKVHVIDSNFTQYFLQVDTIQKKKKGIIPLWALSVFNLTSSIMLHL